MDNASDYESEDCWFESCQDRYTFLIAWKGIEPYCIRRSYGASVWLRIRGLQVRVLLGSIFYRRIARIPGWAMLWMLPKNRMAVRLEWAKVSRLYRCLVLNGQHIVGLNFDPGSKNISRDMYHCTYSIVDEYLKYISMCRSLLLWR